MNPFRLLQTLGMPVAYFKHDNEQQAPFLVYYGGGAENSTADNQVYHSVDSYTVEYYFDKKSSATEKQIQQLFDENEIVWDKSEDIYLQDENLFLIYYYI